MTRPRAAHFLLNPDLAGSPPNEAIVAALGELGYAVDLFAPGSSVLSGATGNVEYGNRWIVKNVLSRRWRRYDVFSGTTEDPMAVAGLLSRVHRRPCFTLADEIFSGSYAGNRNARWKALCRSGMRRARFTIVNDESRIELQRGYAELAPAHPIIVYPGCFREAPPPAHRARLRAERGIPPNAFTVAYSGVFNLGNGGLWMATLLDQRPDVHVWGQVVGADSLVRGLLTRLRGSERLYLEPSRLSWRDSWSSMAAVDMGIVVYLQDAPQFRNMGISSNRLCMFLSMGVPVVASRQPSFEFLERYECGILVDDEAGFLAAVDMIRSNLNAMKANALRCAREHIRAAEYYRALVETMRSVTSGR